MTAISGPEGTGKTLLGLHFLAAATAVEPGLLFGLDESGEMAEPISAAFGIELDRLKHEGALHLAGQPRIGESLDEEGYRLLAAVRDSGARRVFIDGLASVVAMPAYEERGAAFFAALFRELRRLGVTTLFSVRATPDGTVLPPGREVAPLADNSLRVDVTQRGANAVRSVSISKVQASRHDPSSHELELTTAGLRVGASLDAQRGGT